MSDSEGALVCRCEEVSYEEMRVAIAAGAMSGRELKLRTRMGMGACQGRVCRSVILRVLGPMGPEDDLSFRSPVRLTSVGDILGECGPTLGEEGKS